MKICSPNRIFQYLVSSTNLIFSLLYVFYRVYADKIVFKVAITLYVTKIFIISNSNIFLICDIIL